MSKLWIFDEPQNDGADEVRPVAPEDALRITDNGEEIADELAAIGINFRRWSSRDMPADASPEQVLELYAPDIENFRQERGFSTADVISLTPSHPQKEEMRKKFLNEHQHAEDEIRFFLRGNGLFYIHSHGKVYATLCEKDDLISVPDGTTHWFDMGPEPDFMALRLFTNTEGWVANFTGDPIAGHLPRYEQLAG